MFSPETEKRQTQVMRQMIQPLYSVLPKNREETDPSHETDDSTPIFCSPQKPRRDRPKSWDRWFNPYILFSPKTEKRQTHPRHESDESNLDNGLPKNREETDPPKSWVRWVKPRQCSPQKPRRDRPKSWDRWFKPYILFSPGTRMSQT